MKKLFLLSTALFFVVAANAQLSGKRSEVKDAHDRYANIDTVAALLPEGTAVKSGKVMLKNGYRILILDSNRVIVVQRQNGENTGAFRCSCTTVNKAGSDRVAFTGDEIHCISGCSMDVVLNPEKNISITQRSGNWRKLTLSSAGMQLRKIEDSINKKKDLKAKQ
jgi:hypothetical protein